MHTPPDTLKSLHSLLVENHEAGRPLLDGAVLYRGTRLPDQTQGAFSQAEMHGSLLVQVAAAYTHNWTTTDTGFIGEYPVTRDTRFYADFGLEQAQNGKDVKSHSVQDVEAALTPLVEKLATAKNPRDVLATSEAIEKMVKQHFYEASVPTRTPEGAPNRPNTLYGYHGTPMVNTRDEVLPALEKITHENQHVPKEAVYARYRNEVQQELHGLELTQAFLAGKVTIRRAVSPKLSLAERSKLSTAICRSMLSLIGSPVTRSLPASNIWAR